MMHIPTQGSLVIEYFMVCCSDTLCMAIQVEFTTTNIDREGVLPEQIMKASHPSLPEGQNSYFLQNNIPLCNAARGGLSK